MRNFSAGWKEKVAMEEAAAVRSFNEEALLKEYYEILKIVGEFDGRLMM
jgi:hypothetical protein